MAEIAIKDVYKTRDSSQAARSHPMTFVYIVAYESRVELVEHN